VYNQEYSLGERQKKRQKRLTFYFFDMPKKTKRTQNKQKIKEGIFQRKEFFFSSLLLLNNAPLPQKKDQTPLDQTTTTDL